MKRYLIVSSVILHVVALATLSWFVSIFWNAQEKGRDWAVAAENSEVGVVEDVATIVKEGASYTGYAIDLNGQKLYMEEYGEDSYKEALLSR